MDNDPSWAAEQMHPRSSLGRRRRLTTLVAAGAVAATALGGAGGAQAETVDSATLTWNVPHSTSAAGGINSLSGYATTIGGGNVTASGGATGGPITSSSTPAPGTGVVYPFTFPGASTIGTLNPATKQGTMAFTGTLTVNAHGGKFLEVINPGLSFDAPNLTSIRVVANGGGEVSPAQGSPEGTPPSVIPAAATVFALAGGTATNNADGSVTITGMVGEAATGGLSSNARYDSIRSFFASRPLNTFDVTYKLAGAPPATAQCADGVDNDADTQIDLADPGCANAEDNDETNAAAPSGASDSLTVNGAVNAASSLSLSLGQESVNLGTFVPGTAADYTTDVSASVTSTGAAVLTVQDGGANPGFLLNGSTPLATALQARAGHTGSLGTYATITGSPVTLLTFASAVNNDAVIIGLKQAITAAEPLTSGTYGKTLTFTVTSTA